jgi:DNA repair and recombination protein RAD54B
LPPKCKHAQITSCLLLTQCKDEYVVFVTPTALQLSIFSKILNPDRLDDIIEYSTAESLALINILTKISNSPILLKAVADRAKVKINQGHDNVERTTVVEEAVKLLPERAQVEDISLSGGVHNRLFIVEHS